MNRVKMTFLASLTVFLWAVPAVAGDFDGSKALLCVPITLLECGPDGVCDRVTPESINLPQFLWIDFENKKISRTQGNAKGASDIENMEHIDGKLILQGAEDGIEGVRDGLGWSIAISEDTGKMVLSASGDDVGFVAFGACTTR